MKIDKQKFIETIDWNIGECEHSKELFSKRNAFAISKDYEGRVWALKLAKLILEECIIEDKE